MTPIFSILFIITVVISASLLVIILAYQFQSGRTYKILSTFKRAAAESGVSIDRQELIGKRIIGVDTENRKLLFFSSAGKRAGYFLDLFDIQSVEVNYEYGLTFNKYSRNKIAETDVAKVALHIYYKDGGKRVILPFYDNLVDERSYIELRTKQARQWRDILSSIATSKGPPVEASRIADFTTYQDAA